MLADEDTERTIGLEIARVMLPDPQGRARRGILLVVYDVGGHDEYQEMQQVFVTPNTLYLLLWNVAKQPAEGQDVRSFERERVAQQVRWAQIIQSCAPGSMVRSSSASPCFHTLSFRSPGAPCSRCCGYSSCSCSSSCPSSNFCFLLSC